MTPKKSTGCGRAPSLQVILLPFAFCLTHHAGSKKNLENGQLAMQETLLQNESTHLLRVPYTYQYPLTRQTACPRFHKTQIEKEKTCISYTRLNINSSVWFPLVLHRIMYHSSLQKGALHTLREHLSLYFIVNANQLSLRQLDKLCSL